MKGGRRRVLVIVFKLRDRYQVALLTFIIFILSLFLNLFLCTGAVWNFYGHLNFLTRHILISVCLGDEHFCCNYLFWACNMQAHRREKLVFHLFQLVVKFTIFRWLVIVIIPLSMLDIFFRFLRTHNHSLLLQNWLILRVLPRVRLIVYTSFIIMRRAVRRRRLLFMKTSILIAVWIITFILTALD